MMGIALLGYAGHVLHYAKTRGVRPLVRKALHNVVGREHWYVTSGALEPWLHAPRRDPGIDIHLATPADLPGLARLGRQRPDTLRAWTSPRHFLFVAVADGDVVGYRALGREPHRWVAGFFRLRADQIYGLDLFIHPAWRGRGLTYEMMAESNPMLVALGYREVLSIQRRDNAESITMTEARGITRLGTLERRSLLGRVSFRFEPAPLTAVARVSATARVA